MKWLTCRSRRITPRPATKHEISNFAATGSLALRSAGLSAHSFVAMWVMGQPRKAGYTTTMLLCAGETHAPRCGYVASAFDLATAGKWTARLKIMTPIFIQCQLRSISHFFQTVVKQYGSPMWSYLCVVASALHSITLPNDNCKRIPQSSDFKDHTASSGSRLMVP